MLARTMLLVCLSSGAAMVAAQSPEVPFQEVEVIPVDTPYVPRSMDSSTATVVVVLSGEPVAVAQAKAGRVLTRAEKDSIIAARKQEQSAVRPQIEAHGGRVLNAYQSALNGIKVEVPKNQLPALAAIAGVIAVKPVGIYEPINTVSVPFIGAPQIWQGRPPFRGQGVKIAIIDTGIDYTHANFGGPGTIAAFQAAAANSTAPADPTLFGDNAPKVKGGIDLVGDSYNANPRSPTYQPVPHPDPNPLDCNGHGSHTAGTAAGFGVASNGTTYTGRYDAGAYTAGAFSIGPGVAPMAQLYAVRVFGCQGSTSVVSEAIDWAVDNNMDVISMSLGSPWGPADNSESEAIRNASDAGIIVVASAGNSGPVPYIAGSPAGSDGALSVAAMDSTPSFPAANLALAGAANPIVVLDANGAAFVEGGRLPIAVLRNADGTVSLGCNESEYVDVLISGKLVVTARGTCARVLRAQYGFKHGAAAVAMINNSSGYPPQEGDIAALSGGGNVTIPFFGVLKADAAALAGPIGGPAPASAVETAANLPNPGFERVASFSSGGPRYGDSVLKPNVTAPGVAVVSTAVGSGNGRVAESGTSMAAPHVAGVAALVKEANRQWPVGDLRAAVVQTAAPTKMLDYSPRVEGAGVVQALPAVNTQAVVRASDDTLSFGFADVVSDVNASRTLTVHNAGNKPVVFNVSAVKVVGPAGANVTAPASVTVPARGDTPLPVTLTVPAAGVRGTHSAAGACCFFDEVGGYLQLTPSTSAANNGVALTIPYYLVAHHRSNLAVDRDSINATGSTTLQISNIGAASLASTPDFYALGLTVAETQGVKYADTRAVGVKALTTGSGTAADPMLVFAINTFERFSSAVPHEWDVLIDTTGSGNPNFALVGVNGSLVTSAAPAQNAVVAVLFNYRTGAITSLRLADVATDNATLLLAVRASALGLTATRGAFTYWEQHYNGLDGSSAVMPGSARFDAFAPPLQVTYQGGPVSANGTLSATVNVQSADAKGLMIVAPDNPSTTGSRQALLLPTAR